MDVFRLTRDELMRAVRAARRRCDAATARACLQELRRRARKLPRGQRTKAKAVTGQSGAESTLLSRARAPSRAWIERAAQIAKGFESDRGGPRCVYVVLLDMFEVGRGYALYVGESVKPAEERFLQHKAGYKSSRHVRKYGVRVLKTIARHLTRLSPGAAKRIESSLALRLRRAGYHVEGGH